MTYPLPARYSDLIENPSPRCACMLVLDDSFSMSGGLLTFKNRPIDELNAGLAQFLQEIQDDEFASYSVEIGVVTTSSPDVEMLSLTPSHQIEGFDTLKPNGCTPLGRAVDTALCALEQRKTEYKKNGVAYYQPWLVLISDGAPTDHWQESARKAKALAEERKLVVLPVAVQGADINILSQFSNRPAKQLQGLKFKDFFAWLSASMAQVSRSASTASAIDLPSTTGWDSI